MQLIRASLYRGPSPAQKEREFIASAAAMRQGRADIREQPDLLPEARAHHQPHTIQDFQAGRISQAI